MTLWWKRAIVTTPDINKNNSFKYLYINKKRHELNIKHAMEKISRRQTADTFLKIARK